MPALESTIRRRRVERGSAGSACIRFRSSRLAWQYAQPTAYRKTVRGVLRFPATILWNTTVDA